MKFFARLEGFFNEKRIATYLSFLLLHKNRIHLLTLLLGVACLFFASRLQLKPSFAELLPDQLESVKRFNHVVDRIGGMGLLLVGVESPSFQANKKFVDALAQKLETIGPEEIRYFEYRFDQVRSFFEKYGLHYLKTDDLFKLKKNLEENIEKKVQKKKDSAFSLFLGLDEEEDDEGEIGPNVFDENEFLQEFDPNLKRYLDYPESYLSSDDGTLLAIGIVSSKSSLSLGDAEIFVEKVNQLVQELDPSSYHQELKVNFAGNVQRSIEEVQVVKKDILSTAILLVTLIVLVLILFFWSLTLVFYISLNLVISLVAVLAFTQITIGYLNTMTGFLSSLVIGTGINYAVILISRYIEDRRKGIDSFASMVNALSGTIVATLLGSTTTALSFVTLLFAHNKGFSQFGIIGGVGVLLTWVCTFTLLPLWIVRGDGRHFDSSRIHPLSSFLGNVSFEVGNFITKKASILLIFFVFASILFINPVRNFLKDPFEYDFTRLANKPPRDGSGASAMHKRIQNEIYKSSLTPAVVMMETEEQAKELCGEIRALVASLPEDERVFQSCLSVYEILPNNEIYAENQVIRKELQESIRKLLGQKWFRVSESDFVRSLYMIHLNHSIEAPTIKDLPLQVTRRFTEPGGQFGLMGFVYSDNNKPLEDGKNLLNYTKAFATIELPRSQAVVSAAGENFIIADLLRTIKKDGPLISLVSFLGVAFLAFVMTGSVRAGMVISFCMMATTWWLIGVQGYFLMKFNFLNFIALPLTFGIGVDYPINVYMRFKQNKFREYGEVLKATGAAVLLCSLTTIIGYATMLGASNQALASFAKLALIGEFASITAAIVLLPVLVRFFLIQQKHLK